MKKFSSLIVTVVFCSGCAALHHAQIGEIDNRNGQISHARKFDVKVSEMGFDLEQAADIARGVRGKRRDKEVDQIENIISAFQFGPTTGGKVFTDKYAEYLITAIKAECPDGQITGLMTVRETRKYPVISGEIVKVTGYCVAR